jgi:hypothetical protein
MPISGLFHRDINDYDENDLSFIKKIAAIGDSYSAGIGAGSLLARDYHGKTVVIGRTNWDQRVSANVLETMPEFNCRRYDHSYPWIINEDPRLGDPAGRTFQFESCSGAVIADVIKDQIPSLDADQQVILLSAGKPRHVGLVV